MRIIQHVEQIFRTLNLNSPTPLLQPSAMPLASLDTALDFSPSSQSSALMTPSDLSPVHPSLDLKFNPALDFGPPLSRGFQDLSRGLPLIEQGTPDRPHAFLPPISTPTYNRATAMINRLQTPAYQAQMARPTFQPFSSPESPLVPTHSRLSSVMQNMPSTMPFFDVARQRSDSWRPHQPILSNDWMGPEDHFFNDDRAIMLQDFQPRMPPQPFASPPPPQVQQSHDVSGIVSLSVLYTMHLPLPHSPSTFCRSCIRRRPRRIMSSSRVSSSLPTNRRLSSSSRSSRLPRWRSAPRLLTPYARAALR